MTGKYDDIINLPRPASRKHPPMPMSDRAAQFSPFAALTGYDEAVMETGRLTNRKRELNDEEIAALNQKLQFLSEHLKEPPTVTVTFFIPDAKKTGGSYATKTRRLKKIDTFERWIQLDDGVKIPIDDIASIDDTPTC